MKLLLLFFFPALLVGCSRGIDDVPLQERYKMAYMSTVCSRMQPYVEKYKANPLENSWTYSHGFTTVKQRDEYVLNVPKMIGFDVIIRSHQIPSDFVPNPSTYSSNEIASSCPKVHSEFMSIPF